MKLTPAKNVENHGVDDKATNDHYESQSSIEHHQRNHHQWNHHRSPSTTNRTPPRMEPTHTLHLQQSRTSNDCEPPPTATHLHNRTPPTTSKVLPQLKTHNSLLLSSHIYHPSHIYYSINSSPTTVEVTHHN